jgi:type II secretory pathway pseudopilin PulG
VETLAEVILALLLVGFVRAYIADGWPGAKRFVRVKVVGS